MEKVQGNAKEVEIKTVDNNGIVLATHKISTPQENVIEQNNRNIIQNTKNNQGKMFRT